MFDDIDRAAISEFGFSISELQILLAEACIIAREMEQTVICMERKELIYELSERLDWRPKKIGQAVILLSLNQRSGFLKPPSPFKGYDVYPWKFNRSLSYIRRPFLIRKSASKTEVLWGMRHVYKAGGFLKNLCLQGKLKVSSKEMKNAISKLRNWQGEMFNDKVADLFEQNTDLLVKRRVEKIGKLQVKGEQGKLGDIDILIADPTNKVLQVIECKNYGQAKIPHEIANEMEQLFIGRRKKNSNNREKPDVKKHLARTKWVEDNLPAVLNWLNLDTSDCWKVEALVVTNSELPTPHLYQSPIPVTSFIELSKKIVQELN